jgi:hypothetical protein
VCEPSQTIPDPCGGSEWHFVYVVDESQCGAEKKEFWADAANVQACADQQLQDYPSFTLGPVDSDPCVWVCQHSPPGEPTGTPVRICAFSEDAFNACKASKCADCSYTDAQPDVCDPDP